MLLLSILYLSCASFPSSVSGLRHLLDAAACLVFLMSHHLASCHLCGMADALIFLDGGACTALISCHVSTNIIDSIP